MVIQNIKNDIQVGIQHQFVWTARKNAQGQIRVHNLSSLQQLCHLDYTLYQMHYLKLQEMENNRGDKRVFSDHINRLQHVRHSSGEMAKQYVNPSGQAGITFCEKINILYGFTDEYQTGSMMYKVMTEVNGVLVHRIEHNDSLEYVKGGRHEITKRTAREKFIQDEMKRMEVMDRIRYNQMNFRTTHRDIVDIR